MNYEWWAKVASDTPGQSAMCCSLPTQPTWSRRISFPPCPSDEWFVALAPFLKKVKDRKKDIMRIDLIYQLL